MEPSKNALRARAWRATHREQWLAYKREWMRKWRAANPEKQKALAKRYAANHKKRREAEKASLAAASCVESG